MYYEAQKYNEIKINKFEYKYMYAVWALIVVAFWGFNAAVTRVSATEFPIFLFISIRFLLTGLLFLPFAKLKKEDIIKFINIGLMFNVGHIGLIFFGLYHLQSASSTAIQQLQVPMSMALAYIFFREKLSKIQLFGTFLAIAGVVIIYGAPEVNLIGFIIIIIAAFFWAITQILMKKYGSFHLPTFAAYTSLFSVPFLLILSFVFDEPVVFSEINYQKFWITMSYQVLALGFATAMWQKIVRENGVNKIAPFSLLSIVFATLGGIILLGEHITKNVAIGSIIVMCGVFLANKKNSPLKNKE